ncbi:hypothetical protein BU26DRAFT_523389 [Trematosphaeria pertusa]|uniref:Reverse transcriptase domain-containing protein n=1 Tax=Trematosphaeria pertusa TaxID=390896 RepID=A0A6A6I1R9_9PLEO|nr:uncharacterized protein BU26DRAFT_523389 [Trematosphaeria pertusa]KAF2243813.1 hypothetical protein BU26DRAFT_523389 [Trematosphaeria pertusa]
MSPSVSPLVVSPILREAAELKIEELNRTKAALKNRYEDNPAVAAAGDDTLKRLEALLDQIKKFDPYLERDDDLPLLSRYVEQAKDDRSVSQAKLLRFEKELREKLAKHANRLEVSSLHVDLLKEALSAEVSLPSMAAKLEKAALDDEFELVEGELEAVYETFEKNTFASKHVDTKAMEEYLSGLFDNSAAEEQLDKLREHIGDYGKDVMEGSEEVDGEIVEWCIVDLLRNGLLSDEKTKTLRGYLQNPIAIRELTSTLNMKSVRHWNWRNYEKGLAVTARQNADGKYCITVEEDIIDMLFLHSLAVGWSMKFKECLKDLISYKGVWPGNALLSNEELDKREYYLLGLRPTYKAKSCTTCHGPPPPPVVEVIPSGPRSGPPPPVWKPKKKKRTGCPPPPPPPAPIPGGPNLNDERYRAYIRDFFLPRLPKLNGSSPESVSANDTQATLLKTLVTEAKLREAFDGSAHGLTANFSSFASSLPHQTVLAVLKFIGVPEQWLDVFARFLAAPLNMGPVVRGTSDQILPRTCGVPVAHGLSAFFEEAVLFFLDLVIHQKTGGYLYRLRDKCYFVGTRSQRTNAQDEVIRFAKATGLPAEVTKPLHVQIGFLNIHVGPEGPEEPEPVSFSIIDAEVEAYARRVKKQLAACGTVFEWIRIWNNTVGTYASHLFGPLANVFGKAHLEAVTQAHNRMLDIIFDGGNLTSHVTSLLVTHLGRPLTDPPFALEAVLYLPTAYGGLGIKNPYITLNLAHNILDTPSSQLDSFLQAEKKYHACAEENFKRMTPDTRAQKLSSIFNDDPARIAAALGESTDPSTFLSLAELTANRERASYPFLPPPPYPSPLTFAPMPALIPAYNALLEEPVDNIPESDKITDEVYRLSGRLDMKRWCRLSGEDRWVLQMYGEECFERYGGLEMWHGDSVPMDVLGMVRDEVGDDEDDDSSVSSFSDV